ncbi:ubiquitin carboxyl-terminal hydrolase 4-like, partial [Tropilaelaps mercedesae]
MTVPKVEDKDHQPGQAAAVETGVDTLEHQRDLVAKLQKKPMVQGDRWYLLEHKWFKQWKKYVGYDTWEMSTVGAPTANPGPIDNSSLLKEGNDPEDLREHLIEELDYALMPEEAWDKLVEWYGFVPNQAPIARTVVDYGMFLKNLRVEIYKMELKICLHPNIDDLKTTRFSRVATLEEVDRVARSVFSVPEDANTRLWHRFSTNTLEMITDKSKTIQDESLYSAQVVLLEVQNSNGSWPRSSPASGNSPSPQLGALTCANTVATSSTQHGNAGSSGSNNSGAGASSTTPGSSY